tara:strand:+ start:167 stop:391 length:225 start_codon:yes stop_codon:yes gene_type:complete
MTKNILDKEIGKVQIVELTAEEVAQREKDAADFEKEKADRIAKDEERANLKASAKAKLIAGEALTAEEADTIVL